MAKLLAEGCERDASYHEDGGMTREQRRLRALRRLTVKNGATEHEAAVAAELAREIEERHALGARSLSDLLRHVQPPDPPKRALSRQMWMPLLYVLVLALLFVYMTWAER